MIVKNIPKYDEEPIMSEFASRYWEGNWTIGKHKSSTIE